MIPYPKTPNAFKRNPTNRNAVQVGTWTDSTLAALRAVEWTWTEKVDGTNIRLLWDGERAEMRGRSDRAQLPGRLRLWFERYQEQLTERMYEAFGPSSAALYGEGYGAGIQKGGQYLEHQAFVMFDLMRSDSWLPLDVTQDIASVLGLDHVPIVGKGSIYEAVEFVVSDDFKSHWGDFHPEGIVALPPAPLYNAYGERIKFKLKRKDLV
ncbi:MAG: hypothetical protein GY906_27870 [bacterium]|nr:hypothetical protein [bacterium]